MLRIVDTFEKGTLDPAVRKLHQRASGQGLLYKFGQSAALESWQTWVIEFRCSGEESSEMDNYGKLLLLGSGPTTCVVPAKTNGPELEIIAGQRPEKHPGIALDG